MNIQRLTPEDYTVSNWSGGTTTQIAISPEKALYADRDFLWRLSSATVQLEESDFTALPDYDRLISTLRGNMILTHDSGRPITLKPYQTHAFDGGVHTHSVGKCTDFNLMLRKGKCVGEIEGLHTGGGKTIKTLLRMKDTSKYASFTFLLYCSEGSGQISCGGQEISLSAGESIYIQDPDCEYLHISSAGPADFMAARTAY
ncbi:MAG: HutD family protein [Synergistaceae bacterium]|nr:HutD family protein [Synergistaceae bacterium]